jgi:hypothetical protein
VSSSEQAVRVEKSTCEDLSCDLKTLYVCCSTVISGVCLQLKSELELAEQLENCEE